MKKKILVIESENKLSKIAKKSLNPDAYIFYKESLLLDAINSIEVYEYDIILVHSNIRENEQKSLSLIEKLAEKNPKSQIIFFIDEDEIEYANEVLKIGAYHYLKWPISPEELKLLIDSAEHNQPTVIDKSQFSVEKSDRLGSLIGRSDSMQAIYQRIYQASESDIPVLILGETGTGKDLVAQMIHFLSNRSDGPYLPVNLAALPQQLVASELFGHQKGAFTGAVEQQQGVFEHGSNGTVFLDEIDTIDEKVQISLLRLLEQKSFTRLGSRRQIRTDARILAATNGNIEDKMAQNKFRMDLFYRLDVFRITLPPLRERLSDIPLIVEEFLAKFNSENNKSITTIADDCLEALTSYHWPGNVRELKNIIQRAVLISEGKMLSLNDLPLRFSKSLNNEADILKIKVGTSLEEVEKKLILKTLDITGNNKKKTAELLQISRRALYNKLEKLDIEL